MDSTLLPLEICPLDLGETYFTRKVCYAVNMPIVCDLRGRITYYVVGWPGSVHGNRVRRNCDLRLRTEKYFVSSQYLLTNSAFNSSEHVVPAFKSHPNSQLCSNRRNFNTLPSKPRVKSEHYIGLLKGRFPKLKNTRVRLRDRKSMGMICDYVKACVLLHNLLQNCEYQEE